MKQINNGFMEYYYLNTDGTVLNKTTGKILKTNNIKHQVALKTIAGEYKKICIKELYKLVYNKNFCVDNIEDLEGENWKPIERTNDIYWISDKGRCKSLAGYESIILKPNENNGYYQVKIVQDGCRCNKLLSRLVAAAFLMQPKSIDMQIHHINGNKLENSKENLMWVTPQEHKAIHKRQEPQKKGE